MRKQIVFAAAAAIFVGLTLSAEALPVSVAASGTIQSANANVVTIAGGCGIGWHRGPFGRCLRNFGPRRRIRRCFIRRGPYGRVRRICRWY